jgi:hypothetical protein
VQRVACQFIYGGKATDAAVESAKQSDNEKLSLAASIRDAV